MILCFPIAVTLGLLNIESLIDIKLFPCTLKFVGKHLGTNITSIIGIIEETPDPGKHVSLLVMCQLCLSDICSQGTDITSEICSQGTDITSEMCSRAHISHISL